MKTFRRLLQFYLDASIHVGLAVSSLYYVTLEKLNISFDFWYAIFLWSATIVGYNFIKYGVEARKYILVSTPHHRTIQLFSFIVGFLAFYVLFVYVDTQLYLPLCILAVISALYAIPFLPRAKNLRSLGGVKIFLVALVWAGFTLWIPILAECKVFDLTILWLFLQQLVLVLVLLIPFEIRDLKYDALELRTLPQRFGIAKTKQIGYGLLLFYVLLALIERRVSTIGYWQDVLWIFLLFLALFFTRIQQKNNYAALWVEAIPIVMALFTMLYKSAL
ncbi:hypothetical protein [Flavobacterium sp. ASW18X]|uniref:hypothetical protein n=1 Tax=Flavobacterium sp. ASW18X TaxID=2572595 RepID=UPI0010AE2C9F|nr:hypothetical protein [Flavobacterium sp. ASW18X]TKD59313.1 hypothetical protein FBT53_13240 [Flavobacterium sp. ASW18X]